MRWLEGCSRRSAWLRRGRRGGGEAAQPAAGPGGLRGPPGPPSSGAQASPPAQVLLSLSDEDLELGLGVCSSLHRRKLRLAIEDYRDAEAGRR